MAQEKRDHELDLECGSDHLAEVRPPARFSGQPLRSLSSWRARANRKAMRASLLTARLIPFAGDEHLLHIDRLDEESIRLKFPDFR